MSKRGTDRPQEPGSKGASISILPMELRVGDHFADEAGEWEVISRPVSFRGENPLRAQVQVPGEPATMKEETWEAHERITVPRGIRS